MSVCMHVCSLCACSAWWGLKRALDPMELESQTVVSDHVGSVNWTSVSGRAANVCNFWAISPVLIQVWLNYKLTEFGYICLGKTPFCNFRFCFLCDKKINLVTFEDQRMNDVIINVGVFEVKVSIVNCSHRTFEVPWDLAAAWFAASLFSFVALILLDLSTW